jgi:hypothetical protein
VFTWQVWSTSIPISFVFQCATAYPRVFKYHSDKLHASERRQLENAERKCQMLYCVTPCTINQGTSRGRDISHSVDTQVSQHGISQFRYTIYLQDKTFWNHSSVCLSVSVLVTHQLGLQFRFSQRDVIDSEPRIGPPLLPRVFVNFPVVFVGVRMLLLGICIERWEWKMNLKCSRSCVVYGTGWPINLCEPKTDKEAYYMSTFCQPAEPSTDFHISAINLLKPSGNFTYDQV